MVDFGDVAFSVKTVKPKNSMCVWVCEREKERWKEREKERWKEREKERERGKV